MPENSNSPSGNLLQEARVREKEESRIYDADRLKAGKISAQDLQSENAAFPESWLTDPAIPDFFEKVGK